MSIFDSATPIGREVIIVTANLHWKVPTDPASFVRVHTDDLDLVAVAVSNSGNTTEVVNSYNPRSSCDTVHHSGENVDGRGKKGAPREVITVNLQGNTADAIFFVARVIRGAGLYHSQNSRLIICAGDENLHIAEINRDARVKNMRSAILGALLRSPAGAWHYVEQMVTSVGGYTDEIMPAVQSTYAQLMRA